MASENYIATIEQWITDILVEKPNIFLVSLKVKPTNNYKIFLDGDNGISVDDCIKVNRKLYRQIEEAAWYLDGDFSLEVSSPGVGEPLQLHRQYIKNIDRFVEVICLDETVKEGKLLATTETEITIEQIDGKGKKAITQQIIIPFNNIKTTTVQIKF